MENAPDLDFFTLKNKLEYNYNPIDIDEKKYTINSLINSNINKNNYIDSSFGKKFFEKRQLSGSLMPSIIEYYSIYNKSKRKERIYNTDDVNQEISFYNCLVQIFSHYKNKDVIIPQIPFAGFVEAATQWGKNHEDVAKLILQDYLKKYYIMADISNCCPTNKILIERLLSFPGKLSEYYVNYLKKIYEDDDFPQISSTPDFVLFSKNEKNEPVEPCFVGEIKCPVNFFFINNIDNNNGNKPEFSYESISEYYKKINSNLQVFYKKIKEKIGIQESYIPQLMLEMLCTGVYTNMFVWFTVKEIKIYKVFFSKEICAELLILNLFFYNYYIKQNKNNITLKKIEEMVVTHLTPIEFFSEEETKIYDNFMNNTLKSLKFEEYNENYLNSSIKLTNMPSFIKNKISYAMKNQISFK